MWEMWEMWEMLLSEMKEENSLSTNSSPSDGKPPSYSSITPTNQGLMQGLAGRIMTHFFWAVLVG